MRKKQGNLLVSGNEVKHFAVVANVWDAEARRLLEWHREKAGTSEAIHDVLKNELAAGVLLWPVRPLRLTGSRAD